MKDVLNEPWLGKSHHDPHNKILFDLGTLSRYEYAIITLEIFVYFW